MNIPTFPLHRFAKAVEGQVYYSPAHSCLIVGSGVAIACVAVEGESEEAATDTGGPKPSTVPLAVLGEAHRRTPAGGNAELRLIGGIARLDVTDEVGARLLTLDVPREASLFADAEVKRMRGAIPSQKGGIVLSLNPKLLAVLAAAIGAPEGVELRFYPDPDGEARKPVRVSAVNGGAGYGVLAPMSAPVEKTGVLEKVAEQFNAQHAGEGVSAKVAKP